jgi:environmental stress-induced protein Ves
MYYEGLLPINKHNVQKKTSGLKVRVAHVEVQKLSMCDNGGVTNFLLSQSTMVICNQNQQRITLDSCYRTGPYTGTFEGLLQMDGSRYNLC